MDDPNVKLTLTLVPGPRALTSEGVADLYQCVTGREPTPEGNGQARGAVRVQAYLVEADGDGWGHRPAPASKLSLATNLTKERKTPHGVRRLLS
jgi:hypothetical protein